MELNWRELFKVFKKEKKQTNHVVRTTAKEVVSFNENAFEMYKNENRACKAS